MKLNPQQVSQIMQTQQFADKFNELTTGWKPENKLPDWAVSDKNKMLYELPFASLNMDVESYTELVMSDPNIMEWGLMHKLCIWALNRKPSDTLSHMPKQWTALSPESGEPIGALTAADVLSLPECTQNVEVLLKKQIFQHHVNYISTYYVCLKEIESFVQTKQDEAIQWVARKTAAMNKIIK